MNSTNVKFVPLLILVMLLNILSQTVHETGHLVVYQWLDRDPVWGFIGLVQVWDEPPQNPEGWTPAASPDGEPHWLRISAPLEGRLANAAAAAGGPLASLLVAVIGLWISQKGRNPTIRKIGLGLGLITSFVMFMYYLRAPLRTGGDEYDLAAQLGTEKWLVEIPLGAAFAVCLFVGLRQLETWRNRLKWLGVILLGSFPTGILLMQADGVVRSQVNQDNPLFQPILGYSLPVLIINGLAVAGIATWWYWQKQKPVET